MSNPREPKELTDDVKPFYLKIKALFADSTLDHKNVLKFIQLSMEVVELERDLSGAQKKALVIAVVNYAISDLIPDDEEYVLVEHFVKYFVEQTIDEMVAVNGGKLKLNPKNSRWYKCCSGLFTRK